MRTFRLAAVFAAFALVASSACARAPANDGAIHPVLYVARDADSTLYLFGTVHIRRPNTPWGGPEAQAALNAADEVWTELPISPEDDAHTQQLVMQLGMSDDAHPLSSYLTPEENQRLNALTQRLGVPNAGLQRMKPWLASITLSFVPMMQAGYDPNSGVDRAIDEAADAAGKRRTAFETADQQIGFLANLSPALQREMLVESIDETEQGTVELDQMTAAWERGDVRALQRLVVDDTRRQYPELYNVLFVQRNAAWMERLMHELQGSGVDFVAVGTGHLLGHDGLVEQLRRRGVHVERVRPEAPTSH
jgi:uncharacterized protein YbaP (TraB family)